MDLSICNHVLNRAICFLAVLFLYHLMKCTRVNDPGSCLLCKRVKLHMLVEETDNMAVSKQFLSL